jgi:CRP-like cAMP-binding protein
MAKDVVDTRKLKDQVTEFLKKSKWEKAAEVLEQLVRVEPKDMAHRLKLGDTWRRMEQVQKAVASYEVAARAFADEGQLIKAIGAVKVILEIDPKNEAAQKQLVEMNMRRFAKPTLESAGLKVPPRGIGAGARATSAVELNEARQVASAVGAGLDIDEREAPANLDDEPLELDDGQPSRPDRKGAPGLPQRGFQGPAKAPVAPLPKPGSKPPRPVYDLGSEQELDLSLMDAEVRMQPGGARPAAEAKPAVPAAHSDQRAAAPPAGRPPGAIAPPVGRPPGAIAPRPGNPTASAVRGATPSAPPLADRPPGARPGQTLPEVSIDLEPEIEALPEDAILSPADDLVAPPDSDEITGDDELALDDIQPAPRSAPSAKSPPAQRRAQVSEEISFDDVLPSRPPPPSTRPAASPPGPARPIADLLGSDSEEEIELLSISSDEELVERPMSGARGPRTTPDEADLDAAFGAISPAAMPAAKRAPPKKVPLFDDLKPEAFVELVNKLSYHRHVPGQLIIREGDPGRSFFVIVEGKVRIYKALPDGKELTLAHLGEGAFFGEMALLSGAPRTANVVAEADTEILEVTDVVLRELAQNHPAVVHSLKNFYRQRLLNNVMAISPLFKDFDPAERKAIVEKFKMRQAAAGEVLIAQGKNSDGLYVVLHGSVTVAAQKGVQPVQLARLKEGEIFGEMSLLTRKPATATVTSMGNSLVLKLPREHFQELVLTHPQILELVSDLTEQRKSATEAILAGQGPGHDGMSFL